MELWYHLQTNSNWNIGKFTKPFAGFFKGKKTTYSPQRKSLFVGIYQCWSTSRLHPWLHPLSFLICINDLTEGVTTNAKLFADNTLLFSVAHDTQTSANDLNKDLEIINNWALQWEMNFNPDSTKQAQEVIFSSKAKEICHPPLVFNNTCVSQSSSQKHVVVILDSKPISDEHLKMVL